MVSVEGGGKSKIGEVRFWVCGLAITPADFLRVRSVTNFSKIKKAGTLGLDPLLAALGAMLCALIGQLRERPRAVEAKITHTHTHTERSRSCHRPWHFDGKHSMQNVAIC
jgi:hypothetical protein